MKMTAMLSFVTLLGLMTPSLVTSFVPQFRPPRLGGWRFASQAGVDYSELGLTPKLAQMVDGLRSLPDDKMRVKQVLFLASQGKPMSEELKTAENKVPGCLSVVHVHATLQEDGTLTLQGDSDAQITKGLVNLLVDGLSGYLPSEIQNVQPEFISFAGLGSSLTPGRNNGFVNMLAVIKRKAHDFDPGSTPELPTPSSPAQSSAPVKSRPAGSGSDRSSLYDAIIAKTRVLKPTKVTLDVLDEEGSIFELTVVAECFEGLSGEKRTQLVNTVMRKEKQQAKELTITALSPLEAAE